jgi:hypothetical protein
MEQLQMLKFMIKKARLDFTASWKWGEDDIEQENEWQDLGFSACEHGKKKTEADRQLGLLSEEEGQEAGGDLRHLPDQDQEPEEIDLEDSDRWEEVDYD